MVLEYNNEMKEVKETIIDSISNLGSNIDSFRKDIDEIMDDYYDYFVDTEFKDSDQMITDYLTFLDLYFLDQIPNYRDIYLNNSGNDINYDIYWRERPRSWTKFIHQKEWLEILWNIEKIVKGIKDIKISSFKNIFNDNSGEPKIVIYNKLLSLDQFNELNINYNKKNIKNITIWFIAIWDRSCRYFSLSNNSIDNWLLRDEYFKYFSWNNNILLKRDLADISLPIQTLIRDSISEWIPMPIYKDGVFLERKSLEPKSSIPLYQGNNRFNKIWNIFTNSDVDYRKRQKRIKNIRLNWNSDKTEKILWKHIVHYKNFFKDELLWEPEIDFSIWWAAINNSVILVLEDIIPNKEEWEEYNFYYEHSKNFEWSKSKSNNEKRVLFANSSPLTIHKWISWEKYRKILLEKIELIKSNALKNSNKDYYIVIDKTFDLELQNSDLVWEIPSNCTVINTWSLTKHQRWDTNYFYWVMAVYNNPKISELISEKNNIKWYDLPIDNIYNLPRIRKTEIIENKANILKNREAFKEGIDKANKELNIQYPVKFCDREYFSFIYMPENLWNELFNERNYSMNKRDTFWLLKTHIMHMSIENSDNFTENKNGKTTTMIRVAFWTSLAEEENYELWYSFWKIYRRNIESFLRSF